MENINKFTDLIFSKLYYCKNENVWAITNFMIRTIAYDWKICLHDFQTIPLPSTTRFLPLISVMLIFCLLFLPAPTSIVLCCVNKQTTVKLSQWHTTTLSSQAVAEIQWLVWCLVTYTCCQNKQHKINNGKCWPDTRNMDITGSKLLTR